MKKFAWVFVGTMVLAAPKAGAWGSYGHEQINAAALDAIAETPLGKCFVKNASVIKRLAITPDFDWKMIGHPPTDPELRKKKAIIDKMEHPLHFFEGDAFVLHKNFSPEAVADLPAGKYSTVFPKYADLLAANIKWVLTVDPSKKVKDPDHPTKKEVTDHGTAPWRVRQLFDLGAAALAKKDTTMALLYLGAMGHYVGDMSQPFHASLNYDGQYPDNIARGIHSAFESTILEQAAAKVHAKFDPNTKVWTTFAATEGEVQKALNASLAAAEIPKDKVVASVMALIAADYAYIDPLVKAFADAVGNHKEGDPHPSAHSEDEHEHHRPGAPAADSVPHKRPSAAATRAFAATTLKAPGVPRGTVLHAANVRMGEGAALLAQLWNSAYADALSQNRDAAEIADCQAIKFPDRVVIEKYPAPDYLQ